MTNKVSLTLMRFRSWFIALFQACLVVFSLVFSWLLRFDFSLPHRRTLFLAIPVLVCVRLVALIYFKLLRGWWRYAGASDGMDVLKATGVGSALFFFLMRYVLRITLFPRTIYILEGLLTASLLVGMRLLSRVVAESVRHDASSYKRVILIGAGAAAHMILREIRPPRSGYTAVGCLDDDRSKMGIRIHDVPVLGTVDQLPEILSSEQVDEVFIAVPSATATQMRRFVEICNQSQVKFRTVPALRDVLEGEVSVKQLREVSVEDLLERDPVQIDMVSVHKEIAGRIVLVTGAAGSIGSELCRQLLAYNPCKLVCLDQNETGLFYLRLALDNKNNNPARLSFCVADVRDQEQLRNLLFEFRPAVIFHAAAYKHVSMMESNVKEAIKNNVFSLVGLLELASEAGCESFVLISSDKAVNPTNVMGATKRICELMLSSHPPNGMRCVSVRFGNVLGSSGSVLPVLKEQLRKNQPLTITHPDVRRYFMITAEAVALVLQAFTIGNHGDILVLEMGEQVRILDLARSLIRLSGKSEQEVKIQYIGLREGEKLKEELFYDYEEVFSTCCSKIKRTNALQKNWLEMCRMLDELRTSMSVDGAEPIRAKIRDIVPEYSGKTRQSLYSEAEPSPYVKAQRATGHSALITSSEKGIDATKGTD